MSRHYIVSLIFILVFTACVSLKGRFHISGWWYVGLLAGYVATTVAGSAMLSLQYFIPARCRGRSTSHIALTFDDGPVPGRTEQILDVLDRYQVKGAFFCIGKRVEENPALANEIHARGHVLGNHSFWHAATFDLQLPGAIARELAATNAIVKKTVGVGMRLFRPPFGVTNPMVAHAVRKEKFTVIGWSVRSFDTVIKDPQRLLARTMRSLRGGDIVLFHDQSDSMLQMLPAFIEQAMALGLNVVRVDELLNENAYVDG